ncbi:hypothetical protein HUU59_07565 [bacterium]|nr:hypothetical protein [bacterium]
MFWRRIKSLFGRQARTWNGDFSHLSKVLSERIIPNAMAATQLAVLQFKKDQEVTKKQEETIFFEYLVAFLSLADRSIFRSSLKNDRDSVMNALVETTIIQITESLQSHKSEFATFFISLYNVRQSEYGSCKRLFDGDSGEGPIFCLRTASHLLNAAQHETDETLLVLYAKVMSAFVVLIGEIDAILLHSGVE